MARVRYSLFEALGDWTDPADAAEALDQFRRSILSLAEEQRTGLPDSSRVLAALGLRSGVELAALGGMHPAMGVVRSGGSWTLDARRFDTWAAGQVSVYRRKAGPIVQRSNAKSLF